MLRKIWFTDAPFAIIRFLFVLTNKQVTHNAKLLMY